MTGEKIPVERAELKEAWDDYSQLMYLLYQMKKTTVLTRQDFLDQPAKLAEILNMIHIPKE